MAATVADAALTECMAAAVGGAVLAIATVAAGTAVDPDTVRAVAAAHGDDTFATTLVANEAAREALRVRAESAIGVLRPRYGDGRMLAALRCSSAEPEHNVMGGTVVFDGQMFKTSKGELFVQLWRLLNPGHPLVAAFFEAMRSTQNDLADPDDFLVFFTSSVPHSVLERTAKLLSAASRAALDVVAESK